jgi:hypothetical protein
VDISKIKAKENFHVDISKIKAEKKIFILNKSKDPVTICLKINEG